MKTTPTRLFLAAAVLLSTLGPQLSTAFAQGSLTPPGAPAPTMITLQQIEPRTPITNTASLVTISQPGSYYLTHNLTVSTGDAIDINTNGVTVDLNGFTISSTAPSATGYGVLLNSGLLNISIVNGFIQGGVANNGLGTYSGSGFGYGITYSGTAPVNARVSGVSVSGCQNYGIYLGGGSSTVVESCTVQTVGSYGIVASTVKGCVAWQCGNTAIGGDQVSDCRGFGGNGGDGISATVAQNSQGQGGSAGISASTALNCYGYSFNGPGLSVSTAENCQGHSFNGDGIDATTALNSSGSGGADGINAGNNAQNCSGSSSGSGIGVGAGFTAESCYGTSSSGYGIFTQVAQNCYGSSNGIGVAGIYSQNALNCFGSNGGSGYGIISADTASGCYGYSNSGTGLSATLGNCCVGHTTSGTAFSVTYNVNTYAL